MSANYARRPFSGPRTTPEDIATEAATNPAISKQQFSGSTAAVNTEPSAPKKANNGWGKGLDGRPRKYSGRNGAPYGGAR
jgi:hypothetical protein